MIKCRVMPCVKGPLSLLASIFNPQYLNGESSKEVDPFPYLYQGCERGGLGGYQTVTYMVFHLNIFFDTGSLQQSILDPLYPNCTWFNVFSSFSGTHFHPPAALYLFYLVLMLFLGLFSMLFNPGIV